jgi:hypothetical protein
MRFTQFLTEGKTFTLEQVADIIRTDCTAFLRASKDKPLFRGIPANRIKGSSIVRIDQSSAMFTDHPVNRPPKDSDLNGGGFNFMFNAMMDVAFQEENIRRHSVFVTGSRTVAQQYGAVSFTFPVGPIKYLWSSEIDDSYESELDIQEVIIDNIDDTAVIKSRKPLAKLFDNLADQISPHEWVYDLKGNSEELTKRLLRTDDSSIYSELISALEKTADFLYTNCKNLDVAIQKRAEILLYASKGYYSVPVAMVYDHMVQHKMPIESVYNVNEMYEMLLGMIKGKDTPPAPGATKNET